MTAQQIENMRKVMFSMFGPVALVLPDAEVIAFRDKLQRRANELDTSGLHPNVETNAETTKGNVEADI